MTALTAKLAASTATAHPGEVATTRIPAATGPAIRATASEMARNAFASWSNSNRTVRGRSPVAAG